MKKTTLSLLLIAATLLCFPLASLCEENKISPVEPYVGVIAAIDVKANTIVVGKKDMDLAMKFDVANATFIGYKDLSQIADNDEVTVTYQARTGLMYALTVSKGIAPSTVQKATHPQHPSH